jgi:hypothetical protein
MGDRPPRVNRDGLDGTWPETGRPLQPNQSVRGHVRLLRRSSPGDGDRESEGKTDGPAGRHRISLVDSCPDCIPFVHVSPSVCEGYAKPNRRSWHEDDRQLSASCCRSVELALQPMEGHGTKSRILVRDPARPLGLMINSTGHLIRACTALRSHYLGADRA